MIKYILWLKMQFWLNEYFVIFFLAEVHSSHTKALIYTDCGRVDSEIMWTNVS